MHSLALFLRGLVSMVVMPLAGACALLALAGLAGGLDGRLDIAAHFAPLLAAMAVLLGLASLAGLPDLPRTTSLAYAGVALAAGLVLVVPEYVRDRPETAPADAPDQITLVQFNAWGGRNRSPERALDWLLETSPDIIVMPEANATLVRGLVRNGYSRSCYDAQNGYCGVTIFSRGSPLSRGVVARNTRHDAIPLARAVLRAPDGKSYTVVGAHFVWPTSPQAQERQRRRLESILKDESDRSRLIVAGDLNSAPWSHARREDDRAWGLQRRTLATFSWPTNQVRALGIGVPAPLLPIDHVYAGRAWRTVSITRGPELGSDHYPVIARLALQPASALVIEHTP